MLQEEKLGMFDSLAEMVFSLLFLFMIFASVWFFFCGNLLRGVSCVFGIFICAFMVNVIDEVKAKKKTTLGDPDGYEKKWKQRIFAGRKIREHIREGVGKTRH